jgi:hypothetical protein
MTMNINTMITFPHSPMPLVHSRNTDMCSNKPYFISTLDATVNSMAPNSNDFHPTENRDFVGVSLLTCISFLLCIASLQLEPVNTKSEAGKIL